MNKKKLICRNCVKCDTAWSFCTYYGMPLDNIDVQGSDECFLSQQDLVCKNCKYCDTHNSYCYNFNDEIHDINTDTCDDGIFNHPVQEEIVHDEFKNNPDYVRARLDDDYLDDIDNELEDRDNKNNNGFLKEYSKGYFKKSSIIAEKLELWQKYEESILNNIKKQKDTLWNTLSLCPLFQTYEGSDQCFNEYEKEQDSKRSHMTPQEKYLIEHTQICQNQLLTEIERSANRGR